MPSIVGVSFIRFRNREIDVMRCRQKKMKQKNHNQDSQAIGSCAEKNENPCADGITCAKMNATQIQNKHIYSAKI